jgi:hypothetical protein
MARARKAAEGPQEKPEPPFYEATRDLYLGNPASGAMPVLAYVEGDRVSPDAVANGGWADQVRVPEIFTEQFGEVVRGSAAAAEDAPAGDAESGSDGASQRDDAEVHDKTEGEQFADAAASPQGDAAPAAEEGE